MTESVTTPPTPGSTVTISTAIVTKTTTKSGVTTTEICPIIEIMDTVSNAAAFSDIRTEPEVEDTSPLINGGLTTDIDSTTKNPPVSEAILNK